MKSLQTILFLLAICTVCDAGYRYYYHGSSYRSLYNRIHQLERRVDQLRQPVHIHVSGDKDHASMSPDGTHIDVHVSTDGNAGVGPAALNGEYSYASCYLQPNSASRTRSSVRGNVHLRQKPSSEIEIKVDFSGFPRAGLYGFHVHEVANFENGCNSFGGHYNPYGKNHGGPLDEERHVGDWGNLQVDSSRQIQTTTTDKLASLFGPESIVGRGIVVHAGEDDLGKGGDAGSLKTGNAGPRLACCVIGWNKDGSW